MRASPSRSPGTRGGPPHASRSTPHAPPPPPAPPGGPADNELIEGDELRPKRMGNFVMALCEDLEGKLWVGTEDTGVWSFDPNAAKGRRWARFTRANTGGPPEPDGPTLLSPLPPGEGSVRASSWLGDDHAYALACDKLGRVWVGHLNHGVSVYNGREWRNYDVLTGPLGERVFDIKTCPVDGDVWIATDAGLTRYSIKRDTWSHVARAVAALSGLRCDSFQRLAFASDGTLFAGTQYHGIAIGIPRSGAYERWQDVRADEQFMSGSQSPIPLTPYGTGLPTDLINDILVATDGTVYAATTTGLAWTRDRGRTWGFLRGQDWKAKLDGLYRKPAKIPAVKPPPALLKEDYVTALAEDSRGRVWAGGWRTGCVVLDPRAQTIVAPKDQSNVDFVTSIACTTDGRTFVGSYGSGVCCLGGAAETARAERNALPPAAPPMLPSPAAPPSSVELERTISELDAVKAVPVERQAKVVALDDDWRTQGDWLGRVGRYWCCLSAIRAPDDYVWGAGQEPVRYAAFMGPHRRAEGDLMRYWIWQLYDTDRRVLELPPVYLHSRVIQRLTSWDRNRRPAGWDDHAETYASTFEGPNVYFTLRVPDGQFILSFYFVNYDGHRGPNRHRDYVLSIRLHPDSKSLFYIDDFDRRPELARCRVKDWYGGVYKRFYVRGPISLCVKQDKNWSFNTMVMGILLDSIDEEPRPYFTESGGTRRGDTSAARRSVGRSTAARLLESLRAAQRRNPAYWAARRVEVAALALRYLSAPGLAGDPLGEARENARLLGSCFFEEQLYARWEETQRERGLTTAREIEKALRWDGVAECCAGQGAQMVRDYHTNHLGEVLEELKRLRECKPSAIEAVSH